MIECEFEVVEAVLPAVSWEIVLVEGNDVEEEAWLRVRFAARGLEVRQLAFSEIHFEDGVGDGITSCNCVIACPVGVDESSHIDYTILADWPRGA